MSKQEQLEKDGRAFLLGMIAYVGERCRYCKHEYTSLEDLRERHVVWAHRPEEGEITTNDQRLACKTCFVENNPEAA